MPLDPSLLYPTFLNLIHLADPRNWLSQLLPSILYNTINLSGASGRSNHPKALTERAGDDDVDSEDDPELTPEQREERKRQRRQDRETERWLLGEREKDNCSSDEGDKDELDDIMTQLKDYDTEDSVLTDQ
ncbi:hypothetical protein CPB86DRAFT_820280 [Serendipita vermifera]|nr:hypothetical protein CPB86DRAFT_820280 [Serendipita vermifera]